MVISRAGRVRDSVLDCREIRNLDTNASSMFILFCIIHTSEAFDF